MSGDQALCDVILEGTCLDGGDVEATRKKLAQLFRLPPERAARLLQGKPRVIKTGVPASTAEKYRSAIEGAGANCKVSPASQHACSPSTPGIENAARRPPEPLTTASAPAPAALPSPPGDSPATAQKSAWNFQAASNRITDKLGLEQIEGFSLASFFSEVFKKHDEAAVERLLSVGSLETTPRLDASMAVMPNPWIFFRVLMGAVVAYLVFLAAWKSYENLNLVPGLIMIGSFAVPFSVLILFFELNTPRNVSLVLITKLVVVGGAISLLLSLLLFELTPFMGMFGASAAGFVEETGKLAALLFVVRAEHVRRYRFKLNTLLLGAAVGTGFAAFESAGYALRIGLLDADAMLDNIQLRGVMSPFAHIVWTAIAAHAFYSARQYHDSVVGTLQSGRFLKIFAIPVALHFTWNLPFEGPFMAKYVALGFIAWVVILSLVQSGLKEIAAELNDGGVSAGSTAPSAHQAQQPIREYSKPNKPSAILGPGMGFGKAVSTCLSKFANFNGRATRAEYWWFYLFLTLLSWGMAGAMRNELAGIAVNLALSLPFLSAGARRLHDTGRSGWWQLLFLTLIGGLLLLYWFVSKSQASANAYGPPPEANAA